jgi:hypothetical protein
LEDGISGYNYQNTVLDKPLGIQEVEAPEFLDDEHMKVVRLQPYAPAVFTPRKDSCYSFLLEVEFMKNSSDPIGNFFVLIVLHFAFCLYFNTQHKKPCPLWYFFVLSLFFICTSLS